MNGKAIRVLIVDDEKLARKRLTRFLRAQTDVEIVGICANGPDAIAAIDRTTPDVVFLDVQMPNVDGYQATARIRAAQTQPRPRIVAMTAAAMAEDRDKALAAGMDDYMAKPVRLADLQAHLQRAIPGQPSVQSPAMAAPTLAPPKPL